MNHKEKQGWIDAVMATGLSPATKVYAWGIFKHMYGAKDDSFPGAKALREVTGLNDGHFYKYNKALKDAGFIEVTSRRGTSNTYRLIEGTATGGKYLPPQEVGVPPQEVGVTSTGGTNTLKKTIKKTTMENINKSPVADAPVDTLNSEIKRVPLTSLEIRDLKETCKDRDLEKEQEAELILLIETRQVGGTDFIERKDNALAEIGVEVW